MRGILPAISVARMVMEKTDHVMLAGDQARRFAIQNGLVPQNLVTPEVCRRYELWKRDGDNDAYVHSVDDPPHDTVTMLGMESGKFVAASSTSGMPFKLPGRVGDSPIVGAGIYADDETGAAGATGLGEVLWKQCASFATVEAIGRGLSAQQACDETVANMLRRQPLSRTIPCVVLALDKSGGFGASTTEGEFDLWVWQNGTVFCQHVVAGSA
jgi:isoaspartyl peptidase/L-asparaginase-like protein (Ntn-hydrolase superfamily)